MDKDDKRIFATACMEVEVKIAKELTDGKIKDDECLYRLLSIILEYKQRSVSDNPYQE